MASDTSSVILPRDFSNINVNKGIPDNKRKESLGSNASSSTLNMRRRSTLKSVTSDIIGMLRTRRLTLSKVKHIEPKIKYENTYRIEPVINNEFSEERIKQAAVDVMTSFLENVTYNEVIGGQLACTIADNIKSKVKDMKLPRYRIVCHVMISEQKKHGMEVASMYVWNDKTDNYACATYRNGSISAVAMVHGIYLE